MVVHSAIPITNIDWIAFIATTKDNGGGSKPPPYKYYLPYVKKLASRFDLPALHIYSIRLENWFFSYRPAMVSRILCTLRS